VEKAKESPDCEHLGTQKEPTQVAQREEWGKVTVFICLNSGGNAARALFLVRIGNGDGKQLITDQ
jgi:hypothetical protein